MGFQEIINEIFQGLSGDNKSDIKYLQEEIEKHKDGEYSVEISRALSRKIYELLPDDAKAELNQIIGNEMDTIASIVEEARFQISQHNPGKAEELLRSVISSISLQFNDDEECGYYCFDNSMEISIFAISEKYEKTIRKASYDYSEIYYLLAYCLIELHKLDEAEEALKTALKWNPVSTGIMSELSEVYKLKKDYDNYLYWSKQILKYAYSSKTLARGYRNIAYYFCDIGEYEESAALYYYSRMFEESDQVASELFYISEQLGKLPNPPEIEYIQEIFTKDNIQYGASDFVVGAAFQLSDVYLNNKDFKNALYYLSVVYELTRDKEILKLIDQIKGKMDSDE